MNIDVRHSAILAVFALLLLGISDSEARDARSDNADTASQMIAAHGDPILVVGRNKALVLRGTGAEKLAGSVFSFSGKNTLLVRGGKGRAFRLLPITFYGTGQALLIAGLNLLDAGDPVSITYTNSVCEGVPPCEEACKPVGKTGQQWAKEVPQKGVKGCKRKDDGSQCTATRNDENKACLRTYYTDQDCTKKQKDSEADQGAFRCN
jgi:hypothetical protein